MFSIHIGQNGPGSDDQDYGYGPLLRVVFIILGIILGAVLLSALATTTSKSGQKEDILIVCDRLVMPSVETVQYDRTRLIAVLRKERAANNCGIVREAGIKISERNKVSCSGRSCGLLIQSDIYNDVVRRP